ncbi:MAG: ATP-binding protein [Chloroflexi bacterium]|nr:ATP-binding protein [Chloroflexota bacterium]
MPRPTVRVRLTLLYGALFLLVGVALVILTHLLYRDALTAGPIEGRDGFRAEAELRSAFGERLPSGRSLRELLSRDGRTIFRYVADVRAEAFDEAVEGALREQLIQSALALGATSVVALLLGWVAAGRVLRPVRQITETARASSGSDLRHRVGLRGPDDELKELADTLDSLLEALESAFSSQRAFSQNVSHELRTPLAILRAEAEIRLAAPEAGEEERRFARRVLESAEQGERTVDRLLALARSESGLLSSSEVDLAELTGDVVGELAASASQLDLRLELGEATAWADRALLERLVANLVENAMRHNVAGGWVRVVVATQEDAALLRLSNSGPRLTPEEVEGLFQPFVRRGDPGFSRPGLGLGLPIVRAIVDAHSGAISAEPRAEGGLDISVRLPRRPAP